MPIISAEQEQYSDSFTKFSVALFENYDFEDALKHAKEMKIEAESDILLRPHANEIFRQACLYVYEIKARLQKNGDDMKFFCSTSGIVEAEAINSVYQNLLDQGLLVDKTDKSIIIQGNSHDVKGKINTMTSELVKRTEDLNRTAIAQNSKT